MKFALPDLMKSSQFRGIPAVPSKSIIKATSFVLIDNYCQFSGSAKYCESFAPIHHLLKTC